jgi:hypothetical protein
MAVSKYDSSILTMMLWIIGCLSFIFAAYYPFLTCVVAGIFIFWRIVHVVAQNTPDLDKWINW